MRPGNLNFSTNKIMNFRKTLPKDKGFFSYYAKLIPAIFKVGVLSQLFSASIETYILYSIIHSKIQNVTQDAEVSALICALLLVALLEIGLRSAAAYTVRSILHTKFSGLDKIMTVFIFSLTCALIVCSIALHIEGSKEAIELNSLPPDLVTADFSEHEKDRANIIDDYRADSTLISKSFYDRKKAHEAQRRASGTVQGQKSTIESAAFLSKLSDEKATAMLSLSEKKRSDLDNVKDSKKSASGSLDLKNIMIEKKAQELDAKHSLYLSVFSVLTVIFFLITIVLHEVYKKGSGIEEVAVPVQYDFEPSILEKLISSIENKAQYHFRACIDYIEKSTPAPKAPIAPHHLFDITNIQPEYITIQHRPRRPGNDNDGNENIVATKETRPKPGQTHEKNGDIFNFFESQKNGHTVEHKGKHYTMRDVNSFIDTYFRRAQRAAKVGNLSALDGRIKKLEYWKARKNEFQTA